MEHSIRFGVSIDDLYSMAPELTSRMATDKYRHSYNDWFLMPKERYSINPPEVKSNIIEIPARDGGLDLSESLTGYPVYSNREGEMEFYVDNEKVYKSPNPYYPDNDILKNNWYDIYRDICQFLNGRVMYMLLEDDPRWVFHGRFTVGPYESGNGNNSEIKISYVLEPYKLLPWRSDGDYYWDALFLKDYPNDIVPSSRYQDKVSLINPYQNIRFSGMNVKKEFTSGVMPTVPTIHCKLICQEETDLPTITINAVNETINLNYAKTYTVASNAEPETIIVNDTTYIVKSLDIFDRNIVFVSRENPSMVSHSNGETPNEFYITGNGWMSLDYDLGVL